MKRLIPALALVPALFTSAAFAQTVSDDVSKELWCGEALVVAFSTPPSGVPSEELAKAQGYIEGGNKLIDDASQKYLNSGFTEEQLNKTKTDLVAEVTKVVSGAGGDAKYTFEDCATLLGAPADASTAPAPDASSGAAPDATSSAPASDAMSSSSSQ